LNDADSLAKESLGLLADETKPRPSLPSDSERSGGSESSEEEGQQPRVSTIQQADEQEEQSDTTNSVGSNLQLETKKPRAASPEDTSEASIYEERNRNDTGPSRESIVLTVALEI
jgi:hypothetical protein